MTEDISIRENEAAIFFYGGRHVATSSKASRIHRHRRCRCANVLPPEGVQKPAETHAARQPISPNIPPIGPHQVSGSSRGAARARCRSSSSRSPTQPTQRNRDRFEFERFHAHARHVCPHPTAAGVIKNGSECRLGLLVLTNFSFSSYSSSFLSPYSGRFTWRPPPRLPGVAWRRRRCWGCCSGCSRRRCGRSAERLRPQALRRPAARRRRQRGAALASLPRRRRRGEMEAYISRYFALAGSDLVAAADPPDFERDPRVPAQGGARRGAGLGAGGARAVERT